MNTQVKTGLFGKLPAHGDFVHRNLPSTFISSWDEWMQHFVAGSQEQLGGDWLNIYLTSPIWRFVFSPGVVDEHVWAGIMMPSVDRVGRYFPFSIATMLPVNSNPLDFLNNQDGWFSLVEESSLLALDGQIAIDELTENINNSEMLLESDYIATGKSCDSDAVQIGMMYEEQLPVSVFPNLLDIILTKSLNSYSTWTTKGSELIEPCLFNVQGLPSMNNVPAMLDGQWEYWGWQQPYALKTI